MEAYTGGLPSGLNVAPAGSAHSRVREARLSENERLSMQGTKMQKACFCAVVHRSRRGQPRFRCWHARRTRGRRSAPHWKDGGRARRRKSARKVADAAPALRLQARGAMRAFDGDARVAVSYLLSGARDRVVPAGWERRKWESKMRCASQYKWISVASPSEWTWGTSPGQNQVFIL